VHVRTALARKLLETRLWKWQSRDGSTSILSHLGPAVAVVFFNTAVQNRQKSSGPYCKRELCVPELEF
jgi:hypothetical protein